MAEETINRTEGVSVELNRHKDGTYYWTLKSHNSDPVDDVITMDSKLKGEYCPEPKPEVESE